MLKMKSRRQRYDFSYIKHLLSARGSARVLGRL